MKKNDLLWCLFIGELNLEAKGGYVIWLGHVGGLEYDEEGLLDVLVKLETSYGELDGLCDAARGACKQLGRIAI
ncbi:hypothetical protein Tco_1520207, partial [Tanacetum coccineum]